MAGAGQPGIMGLMNVIQWSRKSFMKTFLSVRVRTFLSVRVRTFLSVRVRRKEYLSF